LSLHVQTITTCTPTAITTIHATTAAAPSGAHDNGRILVAYAKFSQLEEDVDWAVGDSVPASAVLDDLRSRGTPFRTWIPGHVEWTEANMWSFQFDEKKGDGWHYGWKSGRSRTQRASAHVLKAFVFDPSGTTHRRDQWRVVGVASSTPFTITSYRGEHNKKQKRTSSNSAKRTSTTRPLQHLDPSSVPSTSGTSSDEDDQTDRPPDVDENGARSHGLRVLPTGESCLAGTLAIDYIGQVSEQWMRVELYAFSLTHVHVVCVQVAPQRGSGNGIALSCRVDIDEVSRRDEEVGLADEASMD
ncbi:hypothetical protein DYB28_012764, partial [Aphanomyces astaci]